MAKKGESASEALTRPQVTEADQAKARAWFKKAEAERERRAYDYAIECYVTGLGFWPEAVDEGLKPLWALAIQRQQAGGKKPGMMERVKKPTSGKDPKQAMLNALLLLAKDPVNTGYMDAVLKNAAKGLYFETLKWIGEKVRDSLARGEKPDAGRFKTFRQVLVEAGEKAEELGDLPTAVWCYETALESLNYLVSRNPTDMGLRDEQRDLAGKLTIAKGKYDEAESFREAIADADKQKILHDAERVQQSEETLRQVIEAARKEYEASPTVPGKVYALVDALVKSEREDLENEAIGILLKAYKQTDTYAFKVRADDIRLAQHRRRIRELKKKARGGDPQAREKLRQAMIDELRAELEIYRERVEKYPTEQKAKFKLGTALFRARKFDEAIPVLQAAQHDPRFRDQARLLIGRAFLENDDAPDAVEVLREALDEHGTPDDEVGKNLLYWLARALEAAGKADEARAAYGKLVRMDYNFADGDARKRLEALKAAASGEAAGS